MLRLGARMVRHYRSVFAGSFVTMALGVALIGVSAGSLGAVWRLPGVEDRGPVLTVAGREFYRDAVDLRGITTVLALAAVISGFLMVTNVAAAFAFSIALRRRDLGLLRLLGASAARVRLLILAEALCVSVPAAALGVAAAAVATAPVVRLLNRTSLTPVPLPTDVHAAPLLFSFCSGIVLALVAAVLASGRASGVRPAQALREAGIDARVMTAGRWLVGGLALAVGALLLLRSPTATAANATALVIFGTFALVAAAAALGPSLIPALARTLGAPVRRSTVGSVAVASVATARRTTTSLAIPVLGVLAVTGIMVGVLQTTNASDLLDEVARTRSELVVEPVAAATLDPGTLRRMASVPGVRTVVATGTVKVVFATTVDPQGERPDHGGSDAVTASVADLADLSQVHTMSAVEGDLGELTGNRIAVSRDFSSWYDLHVGSALDLAFFDGRRERANIAAVVDGGALMPQLVIPAAMAGPELLPAAHADVLLTAGSDPSAVAQALSAQALSAQAPVRVRSTLDWSTADAAARNRVQDLVMLVLAGPASLFTLVAVASVIVMAFSRRGRDLAGLRLVGVSTGQVRAIVAVETSLVTILAAGLAGLVVGAGLLGLRAALDRDHAVTAIGVPWAMLAAIAAGCLLVGTAAALLAAGRELRRPAVRVLAGRE